MKKILLCVMIIALCVSAAFGGAVQDLLNEMTSKFTSSESHEKAMAEAKAIMTPERIKAVISSGDDINAKGEYGVTLLMLAVGLKNNEAVKALINAGADVNAKDEGEQTILTRAIEVDNPEAVKMLVNAGADVNAKDKWEQTILMTAIKAGNPEIVKMLLEAGADITARQTLGWPQTARGYALQSENPEIRDMADTLLLTSDTATSSLTSINSDTTPEKVRALIKAGADVNAQDYHGKTPLILAVKEEKLEIVKILLNAGADVNIKDNDGKKAINYIKDPRSSEIYFEILKATLGPTKYLGIEINSGANIKKIKALIEAGADVNAKSTSGSTALMYATQNGNIEVMRLLLNVGADINAQNNSGMTALTQLCILAEKTDVIKALIEAGADVNIKDNDGNTALMRAIYKDNLEVVKLLIKAGADINVQNERGTKILDQGLKSRNREIRAIFKILESSNLKNSLLKAAQENTEPSTFRNLIEIGADINVTNSNGATALMTASANTNYPEVINILTNAGIDVNEKAKDGQTALMYAARFNKNPKVIEALINAGADLRATDSFFFGNTAKDWAVKSNASPEIIKILEGL